MTLPLDGISIIDLTRARAGPTAVRQLADMGASVIKVEWSVVFCIDAARTVLPAPAE